MLYYSVCCIIILLNTSRIERKDAGLYLLYILYVCSYISRSYNSSESECVKSAAGSGRVVSLCRKIFIPYSSFTCRKEPREADRNRKGFLYICVFLFVNVFGIQKASASRFCRCGCSARLIFIPWEWVCVRQKRSMPSWVPHHCLFKSPLHSSVFCSLCTAVPGSLLSPPTDRGCLFLMSWKLQGDQISLSILETKP